MTSNGVKQGAAGAIFCVALTAIGLMVRTGTAVSDTQEQVGRVLFGAGALGVMVALVVIAVSLLRSDAP